MQDVRNITTGGKMHSIKHKIAKDLEPLVYIIFKITGLKYFLKILFGFFHVVEKLGYHITLNHSYSPIPDTGELRKNSDIWDRESTLTGIDLNIEVQKFHL